MFNFKSFVSLFLKEKPKPYDFGVIFPNGLTGHEFVSIRSIVDKQIRIGAPVKTILITSKIFILEISFGDCVQEYVLERNTGNIYPLIE